MKNVITSCLMGDCISCGIETLKVCPIEETESIKIVQWQRYANVVAGQKDSGEDWKVTQLQYMDTPTLELLEYLYPRLKDFVTYNFATKWQDKVPQNTS
jgi:hypothetical protein